MANFEWKSVDLIDLNEKKLCVGLGTTCWVTLTVTVVAQDQV